MVDSFSLVFPQVWALKFRILTTFVTLPEELAVAGESALLPRVH